MIWANDSSFNEGIKANYFGAYGPDISLGDLPKYQHGARALERIAKRTTKLFATRGHPVDAADECGRWLEACDVDKVFIRPENSRDKGWLNEGDWEILTVGDFINRLRKCLYVAPPKPVEQAAL